MTAKRKWLTRVVEAELRTDSDDGVLRLSGYASLYNVRSHALQDRNGKFYEIIKPGAFDSILQKNPDVRLTIGHDPERTLARTTAKTLKLTSDAKGLRFDATLPNTSEARDLHTNVAVGNQSECSFVFGNPTCEYQETTDADGNPCRLRVIHNFDNGELKDVSVVPSGAYPGTSVNARANSADEDDETDIDADEDEFDLFGPELDPEKLDCAHVDDGDCRVASCGCQNRMFTKKSRRESFAETLLRCKRVGDEDCDATEFGYVGNPDQTETWRLPVRGAHAAKSLARFARVATTGDREAILERILGAVRMFELDATRSAKAAADAVSDTTARRKNLLSAVLS